MLRGRNKKNKEIKFEDGEELSYLIVALRVGGARGGDQTEGTIKPAEVISAFLSAYENRKEALSY